MKKAKKVLLLALCAVLLVGATIAGTVAYLTSTTTEVKNTFTAGKVQILLVFLPDLFEDDKKKKATKDEDVKEA